MKLKEIMSTDLEYMTVDDNLYEAACLMRDHNIGMIPVVDHEGKLVGVVTDRDLVIRGIAERRPNSLEIGKVMSSVLVKGSPEMTVDEAIRQMQEAQVRRLPIVDQQDRLVGIVSLGDLALKAPQDHMLSQTSKKISETRNPYASNHIQSPYMQ